MENKGIYIHIPFCRKKCNYCDFYLITKLNLINPFLEALNREIRLNSRIYQNEFFDSIFIGGGTPSILTGNKINNIIICLRESFNISDNCEITIESNPEDFIYHPDRLEEFRDAGINRLSLGIQSFNNKELKFLTREHTNENIGKVLENAGNIFRNISADIIYSLPGQERNALKTTIENTVKFNIPHISAYNLIYEPETKLFNDLKINKFRKNDDITESELYQLVNNILSENGYEHYEISNYCKPGFKSIHNLKYWNYINYLGFGPSSHSFFHQTRWKNTKNIIKYINKLEKNELPVENQKRLSTEESMLEFIMLGLRAEGIDINRFKNLFKIDFDNKYQVSIENLVTGGYGVRENGNFRLTEKGYIIADEIVSRYF